MAHTKDPVLCPKCGAGIGHYDDVLVMTRVGGMKIVACGSCRAILGVLPPDK